MVQTNRFPLKFVLQALSSQALDFMAKKHLLADVITIIGTQDIVLVKWIDNNTKGSGKTGFEPAPTGVTARTLPN